MIRILSSVKGRPPPVSHRVCAGNLSAVSRLPTRATPKSRLLCLSWDNVQMSCIGVKSDLPLKYTDYIRTHQIIWGLFEDLGERLPGQERHGGTIGEGIICSTCHPLRM